MDLVKNIGRIDHHHIFSGALGSTWRCVRPFHKSKSMAGWIADTAARTASDRSGLFLLYLFGAKRPAGIFLEKVFHYKIVFSWQATVLAAVVISFPLMYRSARGAIEQVDANLIYAGRTLGMSERTIFWKNYPATGKTGNPLRRRARIHKRARRIRSDCDDRRKYCRKNKDTATRHLF